MEYGLAAGAILFLFVRRKKQPAPDHTEIVHRYDLTRFAYDNPYSRANKDWDQYLNKDEWSARLHEKYPNSWDSNRGIHLYNFSNWAYTTPKYEL